ncbi:lipopolysaccharide biosynthesis protein [Celeribacter sp.]|uniref:lipopolysaccharide biosynthesis protein n=1 Tax=Celeribacter sp. TaxID=1890673 RepID=UPI003A924F7F
MGFLRSSTLVRNIAVVASGTAAAQVIVVAFSPLITRIYGPEVFGLQGVFLSLVGILSPVIALRYPMAIITASNEDDARQLARLSLLISAGIAGILWIGLIAGGETVARLLGADGLGALILFLPLALLSIAYQDVMSFRAARLGAFKLVGRVEILQAFLTNLARVLGGLWAPIAAALVVVTSLAPTVKAVMLRSGAIELRQPSPTLTKEKALELLKIHRDFPIYRMPTDVLNALSQSVPVLLLAALFSPTAAGLYALSRSILHLPSNVIGAAVGNVLYARFAELSRSGQSLLPLLLRSTIALMALAPLIIGCAWFAPTVFAYAFGEEWREAGNYARWMSVWLGVALANIPAVRIAPVVKAQNLLLTMNTVSLAARVSAMLSIAWLGGDAGTAVAAFSLTSVAVNVALILVLFRRCARWNGTLPEHH